MVLDSGVLMCFSRNVGTDDATSPSFAKGGLQNGKTVRTSGILFKHSKPSLITWLLNKMFFSVDETMIKPVLLPKNQAF